MLVGDAADETHWGYHFLLDDEAIASPAAIVRRFGAVPIVKARLADPVDWCDRMYRLRKPSVRRDGDADADTDTDKRRRATAQLIVQRWLPRLLHNGDIHTMAASLEARVPFADRDLVALAASVGPAEGLAGGQEKALLREAAHGLVPEPIRRRKKSALPKDQRPEVEALYRRELARVLAETSPFVGSFVDLPSLRRMLQAPRLSEIERAILFRVICLAHWAAHYNVVAT